MKLLLPVVFLFMFLAAPAQHYPIKKLSFDALTIDDGLSQGMVNCIIQDRFGFMWFATKDGLNRYDGYHFVVYRHDVNNKNSLADNFINYVFEDSKGRLWIGTASHGLDLFNRTTETFIHFTHNNKDSNCIDGNNIVEIKESRNGVLFIATTQGLCAMNETTGKNDRTVFSFISLINFSSRTYIADNGAAWITAGNNKLYCVTGNSKKLISKEVSFDYSQNRMPSNQKSYIQSAVCDTAAHLLYFINYDGINRYNEITGQCENIINKNFLVGYVTEPAMLSHNNIWIPDDTKMLLVDTKNKTTAWIQSADPKYDIMINSVNCVYEDRSGNIWIGTSGYGLLKYNARADKFHHTDDASIGWMHEDNNGNILMVKRGDVVWVFDKKLRSYVKRIPDVTSSKTGYVFGGVEAALQDSDGSYWVAKQVFLHYDDITKKYEYPPFNKNFCFPVYDDNNGVWLGTNNAFAEYDKQTKKFSYFPYPLVIDNSPYKFIEAIYKQNDSIFWLGTTSGLFSFNKNNGNWNQFKNNPADTSSLSYDIIFSLCADPYQPEKYLWVGTNGGGLNRFDFTTRKFLKYSMKDGLPNDVIYGILSDNDGNLWLSTNKGLSEFIYSKNDPVKVSFHNYEMKDGLQSNEFNRYSFCKAKDGTLFFGGVNGFNYFNPHDLSNNNIPPNIVITDFKIVNKPVTIHSSEQLLQKPIYLTNKIVLKYEYNMISFEFSAMDFSQPEKNLYQYKLEGFDKDWIQSGTAHTATYTNLDPGTYTFYVKGSNSDGAWNEAGTSVELTILPPWYMTWWFRLSVIAVILAATYTFYRYRLSQALKLQAVRNRIASDLHDEIGSNLSNISIFSNVAQQKSTGENEVLLRKISEYTHVSMDAMSDIVWMINARNDRFENIFVRMRSLAAELFEAKNCMLHIDLDDALNTVKLSMEKRKHFYLIYKEAINNIAKYAECKDVWIEMKLQQNKVFFLIKDNGKGFEITKEKKGNGLFNMQQRAALLNGKLMITTQPGEGALIELQFEV